MEAYDLVPGRVHRMLMLINEDRQDWFYQDEWRQEIKWLTDRKLARSHAGTPILNRVNLAMKLTPEGQALINKQLGREYNQFDWYRASLNIWLKKREIEAIAQGAAHPRIGPEEVAILSELYMPAGSMYEDSTVKDTLDLVGIVSRSLDEWRKVGDAIPEDQLEHGYGCLNCIKEWIANRVAERAGRNQAAEVGPDLDNLEILIDSNEIVYIHESGVLFGIGVMLYRLGIFLEVPDGYTYWPDDDETAWLVSHLALKPKDGHSGHYERGSFYMSVRSKLALLLEQYA